MSYSIKVGQFAKRINSTKRPTASDLAAFVEYDNVFLKSAPTEYNNPVIRIEAEFASFVPNNYNYAVMFGRWYWITNVVAIRTNLIELHLSIDVLAKARDAILDTKAFIEYGLNEFDAGTAAYRIMDNRRPVGKNPVITETSAQLTGGAFDGGGSYILQAVSNSGGVKCYALTAFQIADLFSTISSDIEMDIDAEIATQDLAALVNVIGYNYKQSLVAESGVNAIKSVHWIPLAFSEISGTQEEIYLGNYGSSRFGKRINANYLWSYTSSINVPWSASDWKRNNTQISIYIPFFGTIPYPVDQCLNQSTIDYKLSLDVLSGDLTIRVTSGSQTIYTGSTCVAAPYAFGLSALSASKVLSGAIQSGSGVLTMASGAIDIGAGVMGMYAGLLGTGAQKAIGGMQGIFSGADQALSGYAQTVQPLITSAGSMGGLASLGQDMNIRATGIYYQVINDPEFESLYGHPVFKVDKPAIGFCKTRGFSLSLGLEPQYISLINRAMDGGVFIE